MRKRTLTSLLVFALMLSQYSLCVNAAMAGISSVSEAPAGLKVSCAAEGIKLSWKAADNAETYIVYRRDESAGASGYESEYGARIAVLSDRKYTDENVTSGNSYSYRIAGRDSDLREGPACKAKSVTYMSTPELTGAISTSKGLKLFWNKLEGAKKYRVMRKVKGGSWKKIKDTVKLNFTDKSASDKKTYFYKLAAISEKGVKSGYSTVLKAAYNKSYNKYKGFTDYVLTLTDSSDGDYSLTRSIERPYLIKNEDGSYFDDGVYMYRSKKIPYKSGGESLDGMDCLGLTPFLIRSYFKVNVSHSRSKQYLVGKEISYKDIRPGDILGMAPPYNGDPNHCFTYVYVGKCPENGRDMVITYNTRHYLLYVMYFDVESFLSEEGHTLRRVTK